MKICKKCGSVNSTVERLTQFEDGSIRPFGVCSKCHSFYEWININESNLVQQILRENLDRYKRKNIKPGEA